MENYTISFEEFEKRFFNKKEHSDLFGLELKKNEKEQKEILKMILGD